MQSDGGLVDFRRFSGLRAILSGPAGGVVGYSQTSYDGDAGKPIIGFDMGGTSTGKTNNPDCDAEQLLIRLARCLQVCWLLRTHIRDNDGWHRVANPATGYQHSRCRWRFAPILV